MDVIVAIGQEVHKRDDNFMPYTVLHNQGQAVLAIEAVSARAAYLRALHHVNQRMAAVRIVGPDGVVHAFEDFERAIWDGSIDERSEQEDPSV